MIRLWFFLVLTSATLAELCDPYYCNNEGVCSLEPETQQKLCKCNDHFEGLTCRNAKDYCKIVGECENGGTCISAIGYNTCHCPPDKIGYLCGTDAANFNATFKNPVVVWNRISPASTQVENLYLTMDEIGEEVMEVEIKVNEVEEDFTIHPDSYDPKKLKSSNLRSTCKRLNIRSCNYIPNRSGYHLIYPIKTAGMPDRVQWQISVVCKSEIMFFALGFIYLEQVQDITCNPQVRFLVG